MTDIVFWVLFGVLAGWIASIVTDTHGRQRVLGNMIIGIMGALLGGALMRMFNERDLGLSLPSLLTAVCGAVIFLALLQSAQTAHKENREK